MLAANQSANADHFESHGLPHVGLETWKYCDLRGLNVDFDRRGWIVPEVAVQPDGVDIDFKSDDDPFSTDFPEPANSLSALAASRSPTMVVRVQADQQIGDPLELVVKAAEAGINTCRIVIVLEPGARLTIVERHQNDLQSDALVNLLVQVQLKEGSFLDHVRWQENGDDTWLVVRQNCDIAARATHRTFSADTGGRLSRHDLKARLLGEGASVSMEGLIHLDGKRVVDHHLDVHHESPNASSEQNYRAVVDGVSRAVFNGKVTVHAGADGSDAQQTNHNLLLSDSAEIDTKPELEIYADDVTCAHGATVGQLDRNQVYYLRSRGLSESEARAMLTAAFVGQIVDRIPVPAVAEALSHRLGLPRA